MKPLFIVGTQRDIGKTTMSIGLLSEFRKRGLSVGYTKPLGQRVQGADGYILHDDARLLATVLKRTINEDFDMAVPLPSGWVEHELEHLDTTALLEKVVSRFRKLAREYQVVVVESMGHVAAGSCLGLSAAEVSKAIGAKTLLVSGGGIGRAIDEIALCSTFLTARGADLVGVVVNKVWPAKYGRVKKATAAGLKAMNLNCYGVVPYEDILSAPTMEQIFGCVGGELLAGKEHLNKRVLKTIVAAMETEHMIPYIHHGTLVITPGDRSDNIHAVLSTHLLGDQGADAVAGMILTGGLTPGESVQRLIQDAHLPVIVCPDDTYAVASRLRETIFKITPDDSERIEGAARIVAQYVDVDAILELMKD